MQVMAYNMRERSGKIRYRVSDFSVSERLQRHVDLIRTKIMLHLATVECTSPLERQPTARKQNFPLLQWQMSGSDGPRYSV